MIFFNYNLTKPSMENTKNIPVRLYKSFTNIKKIIN